MGDRNGNRSPSQLQGDLPAVECKILRKALNHSIEVWALFP